MEPGKIIMKRGNIEAKTLELNGWGVGDILEGDEGYGADRIVITAVGEESFLCKWDYKAKGVYGEESGNTTLTCREWKKVGEEKLHKCDRLAEALRIAKKYLGESYSPTHCEHDVLTLSVEVAEVSDEDRDRLIHLGFIDDGDEHFKSYEFGSA